MEIFPFHSIWHSCPRKGLLSTFKHLLILTTLAHSNIGYSFVPTSRMGTTLHSNHLGTSTVLRPNLAPYRGIPFDPNINIWQDELSNAPRVFEFKNPILLSAKTDFTLPDLVTSVLQFIEAHKRLFQVSPKNLRLNPHATIYNSKFQFLKFDVYLDNILVKEANFDVRLVNQRIVQVINESFTEAEPRPQKFAVMDSLIAPLSHSSKHHMRPDYFRVISSSGEYKIIPVGLIKNQLVNGSPVHLELDLNSKQILSAYSDFLTASLPVFIPGFSRNASEAITLVPYYFGALTGVKDQVIYNTDSKAEILDGDYRFNNLEGQAATVVSSDPKFKLQVLAEKKKQQDGSEFFSFSNYSGSKGPENDELFAFGTTYSTIARAKQIVASIDPQLSIWLKTPNKVYVNENEECNAYYIRKDSENPRAGSMNFLQGLSKCNNTGNMADIVAHEWAHGLDDATGGIDDPAFSEGFADIVAFSIFFKPDIGWNLKRDGQPIRDISEFRRYPEDRGEFHTEGLIIASTFFDLYSTLSELKSDPEAKRIFRTYAYLSIKAAKKYTDVYDFLMAFEQDLPLRCVINQTFNKHGLGRFREECQ